MEKSIDGIKTYCSRHGNLKFWFSSVKNKESFDKLVVDFVIDYQQRMQKYFDVDFVEMNFVNYILFYKRIENKIFKILVYDSKKKPAYYINSNFDININLMNHKKEIKNANKMG